MMTESIEGITLVKVRAGKIKSVVSKLAEIKGIDEYFTVTGEFDVVIRIRVKRMEDLQPIIDAIDEIDGVEDISTHIIVKKYR